MKLLIFALLTLVAAGCINVDYTGKKFTPTANVKYCESIEEVDLDNYTLIGRFDVSSRPKIHPYEVEEKVMAQAREFGGDILCLNEVKIVRHGAYTPNELEFGTPNLKNRKISAEERAKLGKIAPLNSKNETHQRRNFCYLLYKSTGEVNRQMGY